MHTKYMCAVCWDERRPQDAVVATQGACTATGFRHVYCSDACEVEWQLARGVNVAIEIGGNTFPGTVPIPRPAPPPSGPIPVHVGIKCVVCSADLPEESSVWLCGSCEVEAVLRDS